MNFLFIVFIFTFFLTKAECKLNLNKQHGIYNNGKSLPEVYRERVLDLHHHGFWQIKISQDMRVSVGYVNKVVHYSSNRQEIVGSCATEIIGAQ